MLNKQNWPIERVAVVLTPLVFAPLASFIAAYVASHFPGIPHPNARQVEGIEIASFVVAGGLVLKWLHGRQIPAIAQLLPSAEQLSVLGAEVQRIVKESDGTPTPDQVRQFIHDELGKQLGPEITRLLQSAVRAAPAPQ